MNIVLEASRRFHGSPFKDKLKISLDHKYRSYTAINTTTDVNSKFAEVKKPNQSASFIIMKEDQTEYLSYANQWLDLTEFRCILERFNTELIILANRLTRLALLSADATEVSVIGSLVKPTTRLRLLHYSILPSSRLDDLYGAPPDTDFGCLTILAQDDIGGFQVQFCDETWLDVPKMENSFVLNVCDMLNCTTKGVLRPTLHRIVNTSGPERYSCVFFDDPNVPHDVKPLKVTRYPKFKTINFSEFFQNELSASFQEHKI